MSDLMSKAVSKVVDNILDTAKGLPSWSNFYCPDCRDKCHGYYTVGQQPYCYTCRNPMKNIKELDQPENWAIFSEELALGPQGSRILIEEDKFKTGLECKTCDGAGHLGELCATCHGSKIENYTDHDTGEERQQMCRFCAIGERGGRLALGFKLCPSCGGKQSSIIVPPSAERRPTTGKIVAVGPDVKLFKVGERVLYTNYTGQDFQIKDSPKLRIMVETDVYCKIKGKKSIVEAVAEKDTSNVGVTPS